jgi:signal transduction histidine kinase/CheY-like chemotaxis protein/CHASE3 domain sensor protein/HPt (histidine-containing phosphotransfer) domain-containing protein
MPWIRRFASNTNVLAALCLAASLLVFGGYSLFTTGRSATDSATLLVHSGEVLRTLARFREDFANIAAAQRGYLLTGDDAFVREREDAITRTEAWIARLRQLVSDNTRQAARAAEIATRLAERVAATRDVAQQRRRDGSFARDRNTGAQLRARQSMEQVLDLAAAFEAEEMALFEQRRRSDAQRQSEASLAVAVSLAGFAAVLLLSYAAVYVESRRRRRSEQQLMEIVENLPVTVWQMLKPPHRPRHFVYVGHRAGRDRGVGAEELMHDASAVSRNVLDEDRQLVSMAFRNSEEKRQPLDFTYRVAMGDGDVRWIHNHARVRSRSDGSLLWTGYWADITPQKELDDALRQATEAAQGASRAKSTFLATMSHEIRTPINGVLGLLELLSLTRLDAEQRATLGVVRESGLSLLRIIDDILDFSKVEAGHLDLHPVPASLRDTISRACQVHSGVASSRGLLLEYTVDPHLSPVLVFDPVRVGQILNNFISNALKFTTHGSVRISAELLQRTEAGERVQLTVTDTGIGVAAETVDRLFEPFVQADAGTWAQYGGTGLGLAISRRLASAMGGEVRMHSKPGVGTRMVLDITLRVADGEPVRNDPAAAMRQLTHAISGRRFAPEPDVAEAEGTLVLVVDDHPTNRMVLSRQVAALGYGAITAEDGEEALGLWRQRRIALVLTDCNMPRRNGYQLANAIRAEEPARGMGRSPILGCTANALSTEAEHCKAAGMDGCLVKPVDLLELMATLERWLPLPASPIAESRPAALAPMLHHALFQPDMLALVSGNDAATERSLVAQFLAAQSADVAALESAAAARNFQEVRRLGHRMLGAAQSLGAYALLAACRALEDATRTEDGPALDADVHELKLCNQQLEAAMRAWMADKDRKARQ